MSNANLGGFVQTRETADRPESLRLRSTIVKPGTMIVHQPDIPAPVLINFPLPAWATLRYDVFRGKAEISNGLPCVCRVAFPSALKWLASLGVFQVNLFL